MVPAPAWCTTAAQRGYISACGARRRTKISGPKAAPPGSSRGSWNRARHPAAGASPPPIWPTVSRTGSASAASMLPKPNDTGGGPLDRKSSRPGGRGSAATFFGQVEEAAHAVPVLPIGRCAAEGRAHGNEVQSGREPGLRHHVSLRRQAVGRAQGGLTRRSQDSVHHGADQTPSQWAHPAAQVRQAGRAEISRGQAVGGQHYLGQGNAWPAPRRRAGGAGKSGPPRRRSRRTAPWRPRTYWWTQYGSRKTVAGR